MDSTSSHKKTFKDQKEFKKIFDAYYPALCLYAASFVNDHSVAEDLTQEIFIKLWTNFGNFSNDYAVKSFLYTSVKNSCLNHLEHLKVIRKHREHTMENEPAESPETSLGIIEEETHRLIYMAINELPPQCRNILMMSMDGLTNDEIAGALHISINTIKTQKKIAYKHLKIRLKDIYTFIVLLGSQAF